MSVLDVGCGNGNFLKFLKQKSFKDLSGIDFLKNESDDITFFQGDFLQHSFDRQYDICASLAVIEHIPDPITYVKTMDSLVKDGGYLILMTINEDALLFQLSKILYRLNIKFAAKRLYDIHHLNHFNRKSLLKVLENVQSNHDGKISIKTLYSDFPANAIDLPEMPNFCKKIMKLIIGLIQLLSNKNNRFLQTIILKKEGC